MSFCKNIEAIVVSLAIAMQASCVSVPREMQKGYVNSNKIPNIATWVPCDVLSAAGNALLYQLEAVGRKTNYVPAYKKSVGQIEQDIRQIGEKARQY